MINPARQALTTPILLVAGLIAATGPWSGKALDRKDVPHRRQLLHGIGKTEAAPHGEGNFYAPEVLVEGGLHRMSYGGQGRDGHDRIHLAESKDGVYWTRRGVVFDNGKDNHVNDPSVVNLGGSYFMYHTRAGAGVEGGSSLGTRRNSNSPYPFGIRRALSRMGVGVASGDGVAMPDSMTRREPSSVLG